MSDRKLFRLQHFPVHVSLFSINITNVITLSLKEHGNKLYFKYLFEKVDFPEIRQLKFFFFSN